MACTVIFEACGYFHYFIVGYLLESFFLYLSISVIFILYVAFRDIFILCILCGSSNIFCIYIDLNRKNIFEVSWLCYYCSPQLITLIFDL